MDYTTHLEFVIDGTSRAFNKIEMPKDGSCLFSSIALIQYGSFSLHYKVRNEIVTYVQQHWEIFGPLTAAPDGDNYPKDKYFSLMSLKETYGSYCEIKAASLIYRTKFYICFQQDGSIVTVGDENCSFTSYLCFSGNLYSGHFDVLEPKSFENNHCSYVNDLSYPTLSDSPRKKRRRRVNDDIRRKQLKLAKLKYSQSNPDINKNAVKKYTALKPEINREAVKKYTALKPEINREAVKNYTEKHPEVHRTASLKYQSKNPEKHLESVKKYSKNNPDKISKIYENKKIKSAADPIEKKNSGFSYDPKYNYSGEMSLGEMKLICSWCNALKFKGESAGMCCKNGTVRLPTPKQLPEPLLSLVTGSHLHSEHFLKNTRKYNACFQMTSFASKKVDLGNFKPTFKVQGQVYHLIGSLYPAPQQKPSFLQIYFIGDETAEKEIRNGICSGVNKDLISELQKMLHATNSYVREFKAAINTVPADSDFRVVIRADRKPASGHKGVYNEPTVGEVAAVIVGQSFERRDVVLHKQNDSLSRISEIHKGYDSLQYPLMFCYGEDEYSIDIRRFNPETKAFHTDEKKTVSSMQYYAYKIMFRNNEANHIFYFRNLFNQYLVDMYAKVETERLRFFRLNQSKLRVEQYNHLHDAIKKSDSTLNDIGKLFVLPSSFSGGPRYMHERTQDALTYVRHYGKPDLFITMTCNPNWTEIIENKDKNQDSYHRHDLIARVFKLKVYKLMDLLKKHKIFGEVQCYVHTIEWQKRGLPHVHILIWLVKKLRAIDIDKIISAEIPDPTQDPVLYELVKTHMIHGPCGTLAPNCPCMVGNSCSKRFPRKLVSETQIGSDGYPLYRRRSREDGGHTVIIGKNKIEMDNSWVVSHSPSLLRYLEAHVNMELCMSVKSIQYILKYIHKGSDQAAFTVTNEFDEITRYETGRYISSNEAVWRILGFFIHEHDPPVIHLSVHEENSQRVTFDPNSPIENVEKPKNSTLMAFFELCQKDDFAKTLYYFEVPQYFTFDKKEGKWHRGRGRGTKVPSFPGIKKSTNLGRVYTVHPNNTECYYLRILLHKVKGPTSFSDLRTFEGITYNTYQLTCLAMGLLEDDKQWNATLEEAAVSDSPKKLRELFVILLTFCNVSDPLGLWENHKENLSNDIRYRYQQKNVDVNSEHISKSIENECLLLLRDLISSTSGKTIASYGLPEPDDLKACPLNADYLREITYDRDILSTKIQENEPLLNLDQRHAYETVLSSVDNEKGEIFFLDAPGGTGKTFLMNLLLAKVRAEGKIAVAVASSGIAATLLDGGRTAHATFKLPLNMNSSETVSCNITKQSNMAAVFKNCVFIEWDESTMSHKAGIEAVDSLLRDIRNNDKLFGGITVLFSGDFRQTLPVVPRGTRADEVNSCLKKSHLWRYIKVLKLKKNMRVHLNNQENADGFSELLLQIGNGTATEENGKIKITDDLGTKFNDIDQFLRQVYGDLQNIDQKPLTWLKERAILTPKNTTVHEINSSIIAQFPSEGITYQSIDTVVEDDDIVRYPVEFLNSLNPSSIPNHNLFLKVGVPVMLLRNLKPPKLCNGTRLRVRTLSKHVIEATIMTGIGEGENVFIPRIPLISSDYPFEFKRLQFPIKPSFAMTINKSQGQSLKKVGVDLREDCFSHGQLYVAFSRVSSPKGLNILQPEGSTQNIVYKEVLSDF